MTSGELKALSDKANAWDSVLSAMMERLPQAFKAAPSPLECVLLWINRASNEPASAPNGDWLWVQLMDWCKKRGYAPAGYDDLFAIVGEARAAQPPPSDCQDETITSLCDRLLKINNICHDRTLRREERLRQVEEWSAGFMHPPGSGPTKCAAPE